MRTVFLWVVAGVIALSACVSLAPAQSAGGDAALPAAVGSGEIKLQVRSLGIGGRVRPGDWTGVEVEFDDIADKPRSVMLRIACNDNDGDTAMMQRVVVSNPGNRQFTWLYLRMPADSGRAGSYRITAHEAVPIGEAQDRRFSQGRLLGSMLFAPQFMSFIREENGLIGVIGARACALDQYTWVIPQGENAPVTGHEETLLSTNLLPDTLPDRWMGLSTLEAIVWTGSGPQEAPGNLREPIAGAITEWVRRGGHLIVVLPPVAQPWIGAPTNPLAGILPQVGVTRKEGVNLNEYRSLLTGSTAELPTDAVVHTFTIDPANTTTLETVPVMAGMSGDVVAVRRLVGCGAVTVIGIDLTSPKLSSIAGALQADRFWNAILGKRPALIPPTQLQILRSGRDPLRPTQSMNPQYDRNSATVEVDEFIAEAIANRGQSFTGLLLAFIVFVAYWVLAGPLSYYVLRSRGLKQYSWLTFVAVAAGFTAIAWTGANLLKVRSVQGRHLTFVDSVYGQTSQRVHSFAGIFLPRYGRQEVSVASGSADADAWHNTLATWEQFVGATTGSTAISAFTNAQGYIVEANDPDETAFPTRATSKEVVIHWAGALPSSSPATTIGGDKMIRPVVSAGTGIGEELRIVPRQKGSGLERDWALEGQIVHDLPKALRNVHIGVVVAPTAPTRQHVSNEDKLAYSGAVVRLQDDWQPKTPISLDGEQVFGLEIERGSSLHSLMGRLLPVPSTALALAKIDDRDAPLALSFYSQLQPPLANAVKPWALMKRNMTHDVDVSRWLNQPCIFVVGELDESAYPAPLSVDGDSSDEVREKILGRTIVRWMYPLPGRPITARVVQPAIDPGTDKLDGE